MKIQIQKQLANIYLNLKLQMSQNNFQPESNAHQSHLPNDINTFDDVPIGGNATKFNISQFAENSHQQDTVSTLNMTLQQKIYSKVVKVKLEGLDQLKNILVNNTQLQFELQLAKILKQNNPACLEKALQCAQKWISLNRNWGDKQLKQIVENGYINGKGNTKKIASELVFKTFEMRGQTAEQLIIETGLKAKTPKIIGGYLSVLNQLLQEFGIKDLKYLKPYLPVVVKVMNNEKLPAVKNQGMNLIKSGLKWLGKDFLWPLLSDLKENMKKQLETFWEGHDKKQVMKANRQKNNIPVSINGKIQKQKGGQQKIIDKQQQEDNGIDVYQISDDVEVFQKFDQKWSQNVLQTQKWNAKTALLQELITKASVPKINNSEHRHITQMIRRLLGDSNFNVVLTSLKLTGVLAKGLRKNFNHSAKILFPYITPKFRDKKTQMIDETFNALNNFHYCLSIEEVGEDIKAALKDKAAGMKNNTIKWITLQIEKRQLGKLSNSETTVQFFKSSSFQTIVQNLLNDPNSQVRDSTAKLVIRSKSIFGENIFKNIDKNINNKDLISKLNDENGEEQGLSKSKCKQTISNKKSQRSASKAKSAKGDTQDQVTQKSYTIKTNDQGLRLIDITEELNKYLKKLNDNTNWQNRKQSAEKLIKYFNQLQKQNPTAKISSQSLHDFVGILKARISDPNKQLIKVFVSLTGQVFRCLGQKQIKIHTRIIIQQLIEAFSDKNDTNRKEIYKAFDRILSAVGIEAMIGYIGQILSQQQINSNVSGSQLGSTCKQYALEYLLPNQNFTNIIDQLQIGQNLKELKDFPKIILSGLCDKNKQLRSVCEKLLKILSEKVGIDVFKNFVNSKDQKSTFKSDLNNFLDKFQNQNFGQQPSMISNHSFLSLNNQKQIQTSRKRSPSINQSKIGVKNAEKIRRKASNATSFHSSRSKNKNSSVLIGDDGSKEYNSNMSIMLKCDQNRIVEGQQPFANIAFLTSQRVAREQSASRYRNNNENHPILYQNQIFSALARLVNYEELYLKMSSNDYKKNQEAVFKLIKLCRDITYTNAIRELWDLFLKWVIIKMYGGSISNISLLELVCPLLSVLQKKKIAWTDYDIDIIIYLNRQYIISSFYEGNLNMQTLKNIFKMATMLSSGERIVKKILIELKIDIAQIHRHVILAKKEGIACTSFYKKTLSKICGYFVDYFSHNGILEQATTIPELSQSQQFIGLLASRFQESVLRDFGFNLQIGCNINTEIKYQQLKTQRFDSKSQIQSNKINSSRSIPHSSAQATIFLSGKQNKIEERSQKKTPQKANLINNSTFYQTNFPPPSPVTKYNLATPIIPIKQSTSNSILPRKQVVTISSVYKNVGLKGPQARYEIDLSIFTPPSHHNPLGSNLLKLYPYNQSTVHFFSTLFQPQNQNSQKIAQQLSSNANMIYGFMFNALIKMMELSVRDSQGPDRTCAFMTLVQQSIKCPNVFKNLSQDIIQKSMRYTIDQLVHQDENRNLIQTRLRSRGFSQFKGDAFIKGINGIMLRLLDNAPPLLIINCLLINLVETMLQIKNNQQINNSLPIINKNKKVGLLIRCFTRATASYFGQKDKEKEKQLAYNIQDDINCIKSHHVFRFILLSKEYLQIMDIADLVNFQTKQSLKVQKSAINISSNTQESVVHSLCKIFKILHKKNLISKNLQNVKKEKIHMKNEKVISEYINHISDLSMSFIGLTGVLGSCNSQGQIYSANQVQSSQVDDQLKKVIQQLSKVKTYNEGIKLLKQYIQQCGNRFDYKSCFLKMNFEASFIQKVSQDLSKLSSTQTQPTTRALNPDIQDKLQKLKMKLEGINNEYEGGIPQKNLQRLDKLTVGRGNNMMNSSSSNNVRGVLQNKTPRAREMSSKSIETHQPNQNDLKKRIQDMKNKVSMTTMNRIR